MLHWATFTNDAGGTITDFGGHLMSRDSTTDGTLSNGGTYIKLDPTTITYFIGVPFDNLAGGLLLGVGTLYANAGVTNDGEISPGTDIGVAGILNIAADYWQTGNGFLSVEIGGTNPGTDYDRLNVSGNVSLGVGATLNDSLIGGFTPPPGQIFVVLTFGSRGFGSDFTNGPSPSFIKTYTPTSMTLTATGLAPATTVRTGSRR